MWNFTFLFRIILPFVNYIMFTWEGYHALPSFPYCKQWNAGWDLGTRLAKWDLQIKEVWYFISKNQQNLLEHSNPFKCSPGSHSQFVSCSVGIMSRCLVLVFLLLAFGQPCVYIASAPWHVELVTPRLLIYSIKPHHVDQNKSHGNNVRDVIIVHGISVDVQTNKQTYRHRRGPGIDRMVDLLLYVLVVAVW